MQPKPTVLLVDDNPTNLSMVADYLEEFDFLIMTARTGEKGLEYARRGQPDLILLDVMMPGMNGFETCRRLKQDASTRDIPVLFMTARADAEDQIKGFAVGGADYITKPVRRELLLARVKMHLKLYRTQKLLQEQNLRLQQLQKAVETTDVGVTITDNAGRIVYVNPADARMHGYRMEDLVGQPSHIYADPAPEAVDAHVSLVPDTSTNWERERINSRKDGTTFPVRLISNTIYDQDGTPIGRVTICEDITERKKIEQAVIEAKDLAESANKAKSIFLANMSHELRTPLNTISGFAEILAHQPHTHEEAEHLDVILRSSDHLLTLINQVLDLSKIEAGRITLDEKEVDLHRLLDDLYDMFSMKADHKGVQLTFERDPDVPGMIRTDEIKLRQVLINLLSNALKFTEEGNVELTITNEQLRTNNERMNTGQGESSEIPHPSFLILHFSVADTGPGIAPEDLEQIFEAFRQSAVGRQAREGTGLGLAISRQFIRLMGGAIRVSSQVGVGSTFRFDIRVETVKQIRSDKRQPFIYTRPVAIGSGQPRYRILIVDDNRENRKLLVTLLSPFELDLREAADGQEAVRMWRDWQPHLIWMDVRMPIMGGYEVIQRIREMEPTRTTKIIVVSASSFDDERSLALAQGGDGFLRKPFREAEIFASLEQHLGLRFVYSQETPAAQNGSAEMITSDALAVALRDFPREFSTTFTQAVQECDVSRIYDLITQIRPEHPAVADALAQLTDDFEYQRLLKLFDDL